MAVSCGSFEEAVWLLGRAIGLRTEEFQVSALGWHEEAAATLKKDLRLVQEDLELYPDDPRARVLGATAAASLGDTALEVESVDKAINADPEDPMLPYNVACTYGMLGR